MLSEIPIKLIENDKNHDSTYIEFLKRKRGQAHRNTEQKSDCQRMREIEEIGKSV